MSDSFNVKTQLQWNKIKYWEKLKKDSCHQNYRYQILKCTIFLKLFWTQYSVHHFFDITSILIKKFSIKPNVEQLFHFHDPEFLDSSSNEATF